jgi:hypothetical protein
VFGYRKSSDKRMSMLVFLSCTSASLGNFIVSYILRLSEWQEICIPPRQLLPLFAGI